MNWWSLEDQRESINHYKEACTDAFKKIKEAKVKMTELEKENERLMDKIPSSATSAVTRGWHRGVKHGDKNICARRSLKKRPSFRWSSPEKGENFTDSASSTIKFMFEYTDPSLRGEVYSNMNFGVLELKLHEVHFADKFSGAELARRRRACLQSARSAVSNVQFQMRR